MGLTDWLKRGMRGQGEKGVPGPSHDEMAMIALSALAGVEVPEHDTDIVSTGLVVGVKAWGDYSKATVYVDYTGSRSKCPLHGLMGDIAWARMLREARLRLQEAGFREAEFIDYRTMKPLEAGDASN